jgi:hypothetical protein
MVQRPLMGLGADCPRVAACFQLFQREPVCLARLRFSWAARGARWRAVTFNFSRPGKPADNARIESFNGRLRHQCLNAHWSLWIDDTHAKIAA